MTDPELESVESPTVTEYRITIRSLIESDVSGGYHPLRKYEKHRAYYCLTGEKLDEPSNGEVCFELLNTLHTEYNADFEPRDAFDCGGPYTKPELGALVDALQAEASDV